MPQINDTTGNQKTSTVVRVDAKAENWERIPIQRGSVDIIEGGLMVRDTNGKAQKPNYVGGGAAIADTTVYINFANPSGGSVYDRQVVNDVGGTQFAIDLESGGYVGVQGDGIRVGLPLTERFFRKADLASMVPGGRLILARETDGAAERTNEIKLGYVAALPAPATANVGALCFGTVDSIDGNVLWFIFGNRGYVN